MRLVDLFRRLLSSKTQLDRDLAQPAEKFVFEQADLLRSGDIGREQALAAISARYPDLTQEQVVHLLGQGLFESR